MKPLDPRLVRQARAARHHIVACVGLGVATAALVLVQAQLLATGIARVVERSVGAEALAGLLLGLGAVVAGRAVISWTTEVMSQRSAIISALVNWLTSPAP